MSCDRGREAAFRAGVGQVGVASLATFLALAGLFFVSCPAHGDSIGAIASTSGEVALSRDGDTQFVPLVAGTALEDFDQLSIGANGAATVLVDNPAGTKTSVISTCP